MKKWREGTPRNSKSRGDKVIARGPAALPAWRVPGPTFPRGSMCLIVLFPGVVQVTSHPGRGQHEQEEMPQGGGPGWGRGHPGAGPSLKAHPHQSCQKIHRSTGNGGPEPARGTPTQTHLPSHPCSRTSEMHTPGPLGGSNCFILKYIWADPKKAWVEGERNDESRMIPGPDVTNTWSTCQSICLSVHPGRTIRSGLLEELS